MKKKRTKNRKKFSLESLQNWCKIQAEYNRNQSNEYELKLYKILKDLHYKFEYQSPLIYKKKGYIVDYLLLEYPIFIEADSKKWHSTPAQIRADNLRTRRLRTLGYEPLRFTNKQIMTYTKESIDTIIKLKIDMINLKKKENGEKT